MLYTVCYVSTGRVFITRYSDVTIQLHVWVGKPLSALRTGVA